LSILGIFEELQELLVLFLVFIGDFLLMNHVNMLLFNIPLTAYLLHKLVLHLS
jgi:hypothetical protein